MSSTNALGLTQITLQFNLSRNIDAAAQDVQAAIAKAAKQLPPDMPTPPVYQKVNPADQPVLYLALTSETLPLSTVNEYAETLMAQRISMINGVAQVQIFGAQKYAVRVQLDPKALASRGLGIDEVADAVKKENVNLPTGTLYGAHQAFTVQATGQLTNAEAYRPLIVAYRDGQPVRLSGPGPGDQQRRKRQDRLLVQQLPGHRPGHPAPAGHQHHRGGGLHQEAAAHLPEPDPRLGATSSPCTTAPSPSGNR